VGVLTCVTTAVTQVQDGPFVTTGHPAATEIDGFFANDICVALGYSAAPLQWDTITVVGPGLIVTRDLTTITTTMRHGLNGKVFSTSSAEASHDRVLVSVSYAPGGGTDVHCHVNT
jgi:hypothetical protein